MHKNQTNKLLGYPDDARLLIINADDIGMCHAINEAILRTLQEGVARSTSLMTPCPWALHAMHILKENSDLSFGVHLTVICDAQYYRWGPLTSREKVTSLVDETGYFYSLERMSEFLARARLDELEVEFRAQIESVLNANLKPAHLDWHCLHDGGRDDIFALTFTLAKEYGLALRTSKPHLVEQLQSQGLPATDHEFLDSFRLNVVDKPAQYVQLLRDLPAGLSGWAVHPGLGNAELQAISPDGWQVRQTDYEFLLSPLARETLQQEGIILLDYRSLQRLWQGR